MRRLGVLALPLVAAAVVVIGTWSPQPAAEGPRAPSAVEVRQSSYACATGGGRVVAAGQAAAGTKVRATVLPDQAVSELGDASRWRTAEPAGDSVVVQQEGRGSGAVGYSSRVADGDGDGLAVAACPRSLDEGWYVGAGSGGKHFSTLELTNLADVPAVADVSLWGTDGPVDAVDSDGIVVDPRSTRRIRLDELAAGERELAVHVQRRRGALAVALDDTSTAVFAGTEALPSTAAPAREVMISGLPAGSRGRTLLVVNPGDDTARVRVGAVGSDGSFALDGLDDVKVEAGSVRELTVPRSSGDEPIALTLTSDHPVTGSVRVAPSDDDYAYGVASAPIDGPALVPVDLGVKAGSPTAVLTADGDATVTMRAFDATMKELATAELDIPDGTTSAVDLGSADVLDVGDADVAYVLLEVAGRVRGAVAYSVDDLLATLPLTSAPVSILAPAVRPVP